MFQFLFWVKIFEMFIVGFSVPVRNIRRSTPCNFLKEYIQQDMSGSGISASSIFVILSIASQLEPGALK